MNFLVKKIASIFFCAFFILGSIFAEETDFDLDKLLKDLQQGTFYEQKIIFVPLDIVLKYGLFFANSIKIADFNQKIAESQFQQDKTPFEPNISTNLSNRISLTPKNITEKKVNFTIPQTDSLNVTFSKKSTSGIDYSIGLQTSNTKNLDYSYSSTSDTVSSTGENSSSAVAAVFSVQVPLGQDFGSINTASIKKKGIDAKKKETEYLSNILTFLQTYATAYWELKRIYSMYTVQYEKTLLSKKLYEESELLQQSGGANTVEVVTNLNEYQKDQTDLRNIWNSIINFNDQIKDALGLINLDLYLFPSDDFTLTKLEKEAEYYLEKMEKFHPSFLNLELEKSRNQIQLQESNNLLRPNIDLHLEYRYQGVGLDSAGAQDNLSISELDNYSVSLNWVYRFPNTRAKEKKNEVRYQGLKLDSQFSQTKSASFLTMRRRLRDLENRQQEITLLKKNIDIIEEIFNQEKIKYENGGSTSLILQEVQTQLVNSKFELSTAQANYESLYHQILVDTGEIFEKYGIITSLK